PPPRPPPRPPPPRPSPVGNGVDHSSTVPYFGPRLTCSSLPPYISFIVARPLSSRMRSVNTSSISAYLPSSIAVRSEPKKSSIGCVSPVGSRGGISLQCVAASTETVHWSRLPSGSSKIGW